MNKDQFGYYLVGQHKTYSKIEALELGHNLNIQPNWIFNDDIFSRYPWHIDTQIDLKQLYKKRAEQIRNKYDYIVIWYSGGVDSFTVLNTFKENNILVDEIAQFHTFEGEKTWNSFLNKEIKTVALPETQRFLESMPHTKHRVVDLTPIVKSVFGYDQNQFDFIYKANHAFGPHHLARSYLREKISDWSKIIASGKKLCFVYGSDKPPVRYNINNNTYFLRFYDIVDSCVGPRTQMLNRPEEHDELFYWSPDAMDIIARQAHIIVNYMRNPPKQDLDSDYLTSSMYTQLLGSDGKYHRYSEKNKIATNINNKIYYLTVKGLNRLIYPDWKEDTFTLGKNIGYIFGPRDRWWWKAHGEKDQRMFSSAIEDYYKKFTKWGFTRFKYLKIISEHDIDSDLKIEDLNLNTMLSVLNDFSTNLKVNTVSNKVSNRKEYNKLKKYLIDKLKSNLDIANDFRNINVDTFFSKEYYIEK